MTRHLWHVYDGSRLLGAILRVNGARETRYQAQPEGFPRAVWETCATFDDAERVLVAVAAGCVAPNACSCAACAAPTPAPDAFPSRVAALEID